MGAGPSHGVAVNSRSQNGWTRLHKAAWEGCLDEVNRLLKTPGIDLEVPCLQRSRTPIYPAVSRGHVEVLRALLRAGARVEVVDAQGYTILHVAAVAGRTEAMQLLLQHLQGMPERAQQVALQAVDHECGRTALQWAASKGHVELVRQLLDAGADVQARGRKGYTALHIAAMVGRWQVVDLLLSHLQSTPGLRSLLAAADTEHRRTALHWAAYGGHSMAVQQLVDAGANTDAHDLTGRTPADIACTSSMKAEQYREEVLRRLQRQATFQEPLQTTSSINSPVPGPEEVGADDDGSPRPALQDGLSQSSAVPSLRDGLGRNSQSTAHFSFTAGVPAPSNASTPSMESQNPPYGLRPLTLASPGAGSRAEATGQGWSYPGRPNHRPPAPLTIVASDTEPPGYASDAISTPGSIPSTLASGSQLASSPANSSWTSVSMPGPSQPVQPDGTPVSVPISSRGTSISGSGSALSSRATSKMQDARAQGLADPMGSDSHLTALHSSGILTWSLNSSNIGNELGPAGERQNTAVAAESGVVAPGNLAALLADIMYTAELLGNACVDAAFFKCKASRLKQRTHILVRCSRVLVNMLSHEAEGRQLRALQETLLTLREVLKDFCEVICQFSRSSGNMLDHAIAFLSSMGFRDKFEILDGQLHLCASQQWMAFQMGGVTEPGELLQSLWEVRAWPQQDQQDRECDLAQLEGCILDALGQQGVQVADAVQDLEALLWQHGLGLSQVVTWLEHMRAGHASLSKHLERVDAGADEVGAMAERIIKYLKQPGLAGRGGPPMFLIPSSTIHVDSGPEAAPWGGYAVVLKAYRDRVGHVAIKVHNINQAGEIDTEAAVREAVKLCRVSHHNVVRCFGILVDQAHPSGRNSISGSLVMEWVDGETMYKWLQRREAPQFFILEWRVQLMLQVAAGMKHVHEQRLVHGDIKPQNILLQFTERELYAEDGTPREIVPIVVKICDFGLAKYNATAQIDTRKPRNHGYTPRYTSPERLQNMRRSREDDMYAFGMLMFFAATSQEPFGYCSDQDLYGHVTHGGRPDQDIDDWVAAHRGGQWEQQLAQKYAALAKRCWQQAPEDRPVGGFQEIYHALEEMLWPSSRPSVE